MSRSYLYQEGRLASASTPITPGMLIHPSAGGTDNPTLEPHDTAEAVPMPVMVAVEMPERMGSGIDDAYDTLGETVLYYIPAVGDRLYMFLEAAGNVAAGALLESNGAGALQADADADGILFRALEAVDNSAGAVNARIRVQRI
jgi:hypothetical protein